MAKLLTALVIAMALGAFTMPASASPTNHYVSDIKE